MERYWTYNIKQNNFIPSVSEPLSAFPTIVDTKLMKVWCRSCRRWENILAFSQNVLKSECGKLYTGPFTQNDSVFCYGYDISRRDKIYYIRIQSQAVATNYRKLMENSFELDLGKKRLYKNGKETFKCEEISGQLCSELTEQFINEIGEEYKNLYGIKPSVMSSLKGVSSFARLYALSVQCEFFCDFPSLGAESL
ncbi:hypothetical protein [Treponema sp.]|uniref:hypothetical protein n=1 Tax=Treponema sp. TaxID=166 RepID=UPI003F11E9A8